MVSKKDELLQGLDSGALLELAKSVSESPVKSSATRADLPKIIKESLSVDEIKRKAKQIKEGPESEELTGDELRSGGVGQLLLGVSGAINTIAYFVTFMTGGTLDYYRTIAPWGLATSILLLIFAILLRVSIVKITWKLGGSGIGTATSLLAYVAAITGIAYYILTILGITITYYTFGSSTLNLLGFALAISNSILIGTTMALLGVFLLLYREYSPSRELWMAGGIIYVIAGASEFSLTTSLYIPTAPFVAGIIGATCFLARRAPK
nr:hypothetical protein [Candidatus Njordarchaeota archaeon]